jgi:uncharacterized protein (TIGR04255 family)
MPPRFPQAERIELKAPPLELVVCQVRFPTILALAANQSPDELQRRLRTKYPVARCRQAASMEAGQALAPSARDQTLPAFPGIH